jgi:hypothetical protein
VQYVVVDDCTAHVVEFEREEIANAVGVRASTMNRPAVPSVRAAAPPPSSVPPPPSSSKPPPRRSKWPTAAFHPSSASPLAEIDLPFQERPTTTRRMVGAPKEPVRTRAKRADPRADTPPERPSSRPAAAATLFEVSQPPPRVSAAPTTRAVAPFLPSTPGAPAVPPPPPLSEPAPPPPLSVPAPPPPPPPPVSGDVGFDYAAIDAAPPPPRRSSPPPRRASFKPPPDAPPQRRASVPAPALPDAPTMPGTEEHELRDTRPERLSARAPAPAATPRSVAPPADATLRKPTSPLAEEVLRKLADVLRKFPEVEWAAEASDGSRVTVIGVRVDPAFLTRVDEIEFAVVELATEQGAAVRVLVLTDPSRMREARNQGNVFFPWRKRAAKKG